MFCSKCGVKAGDTSKFCGNCGSVLQALAQEASPAPVSSEMDITRRQITVLFCDLVGSTTLAERLDHEDLFVAMQAYHNMVKQIAIRLHGHVAKIVGDGVDLYFGYPLAGEDDAVRAVHAGLAIVNDIKHLKDSFGKPINLQVRVGIATGRVTVGMMDTMSIAGATPNLAARIQAEAKPGQVLISPSTRRIAGQQFLYKDMGAHTLKGFSDQVQITEVTDINAHSLTSRSAWRGRDNSLPMVGRVTELAALTQRWDEMLGKPVVGSLLVAEAGMGKSRLGTAFADSLGDDPHLTIRLQCSPFHTNTVLYPFVQHLMAAAGFSRNDSTLVQIEKLEGQLAIADITDVQDQALIASMLGLHLENHYPPLEMPPPAKLAMTEEVLIRYFIELANQAAMTFSDSVLTAYLMGLSNNKPLLLLFDDLHWIDPSSQEFLDRLLQNAELKNTMVLMTTRPSYSHAFKPEANVQRIELQKLQPDAARQMVVNLCSAVALPASAVDMILQKTDGIPLYIEEMTLMVQEAQKTPGAAIAGSMSASNMAVPDTLLDLLTERLDSLGAAKGLAQTASVLGAGFSREFLQAVSALDAASFAEQLDTVLASGMLQRVSENELKFKHALLENTAYDSILLKTRVAMHGRVVACLQGDFASLAQGSPQLLAHHLARAQRELEASRYLLQAGVLSLQSGAPREAAEHLKAGLLELDKVDAGADKSQSELALLSVLGPTTMVLMGPGSAPFGDVQKRAYALCHSLPGQPRQFPITYGLCLYHWGRAEFQIAQPLAARLIDAAKEVQPGSDVGVDEAVMAAGNMNGMIAFHLGQFEAAREHLARSVGLYRPDEHAALYPTYMMDFGVFGRFYLALACFACGDQKSAIGHAHDALQLAPKLNQPHSIGFSLLASMNIAAMCGDAATAQKFASQCVEFSSQFGFPEFIGMGRVVRGWSSAMLGQPQDGLEDLEAGIAMWQMTGFENWQSWFSCLKAQVLDKLGKQAQAKSEIEAQLLRIETNHEMAFKGILLQSLASLA